jgi:DNA-binding GntR family transcriptional regulator
MAVNVAGRSLNGWYITFTRGIHRSVMSSPQALSRPAGLVARQSAATEAENYITQLIFNGELAPGTRVPQDQIAEILGFSKAPIREALIALSHYGWVRLEVNRGAFVVPFSVERFHEQTDLNSILYEYVLRRAIPNLTEADVEAVDAVAAALSQTEAPYEASRLVATLNSMILDIADVHDARSLLKSIASFWPAHSFDLIPEAMTAAKESVPQIADGVRRGDVEAAIIGYRELFEKYATCVMRQVKENGIIEPRAAAQ